MLIFYKELDEVNKSKCDQEGWIALEPKTGAYLSRSTTNERRYILNYFNMAIVIMANSDQEALDQANVGKA